MLSFFRKLSIGGKIKDGIAEETMNTAEDVLNVKNQRLIVTADEAELKDSVYGK